jgi:hypothetical protein
MDIIKPEGIRKVHWHPNALSCSFISRVRGDDDVCAGRIGTYMDLNAPKITGDTSLEFLDRFKASEDLDFSLNPRIGE